MQQKIVIKIQMQCEKCRSKALKTAAEVQGEYHANPLYILWELSTYMYVCKQDIVMTDKKQYLMGVNEAKTLFIYPSIISIFDI